MENKKPTLADLFEKHTPEPVLVFIGENLFLSTIIFLVGLFVLCKYVLLPLWLPLWRRLSRGGTDNNRSIGKICEADADIDHFTE